MSIWHHGLPAFDLGAGHNTPTPSQRLKKAEAETARLRASNAELLAALKICIKALEDKDLGSATWSRIDKAIANAEREP